MPPVTVVTDTTACLPSDVVADTGIEVVSLYVNFEAGARTVRESDLMGDLDATYTEIRHASSWPTTSQPSVGDFAIAYEPLLAEGRDIVSIHISEGISGTCGAARQAAQQLEREGKGGERIRVVDSRTTAGGLGLVVLAAARCAAGGAGADAVEARGADARAALKMWFAVDTLEYLKRSGRIGAARAWIGSTLKIKPILTLESEIAPIERVRTSSRAFERMVDYGRQRASNGADGWVVQHVRSADEARRLVETLSADFAEKPVFVSEIGPVLGVHTGPGLLGVGGIPRSLLE